MKEENIYSVTYRDPENPAKNLTVEVKKITDSELGLSFIKLSDFFFKDTGIIVDPKADDLKKRLKNTKSLHLSLYHIVSIEEQGLNHSGIKFKKDKNNILNLNNMNPH